jgi:hypothetical protein
MMPAVLTKLSDTEAGLSCGEAEELARWSEEVATHRNCMKRILACVNVYLGSLNEVEALF